MSDKEKKEGFEENIEFFEEDQTIDLVLDDGTSMTF